MSRVPVVIARSPRRSLAASLVGAVLVVVALAGCSVSSVNDPIASRTPLPTSGVPDYQLGGSYTPASDVTIVERDSTSYPAKGKYNICYVNGFQTQSEDTAMWTSHHKDVLLRAAGGGYLHDPGWPDEMILDTSTSSKRAEIASVIGKSINRCASRGFDAVEFDNLDSWTRSKGALTKADNLAMAAVLVGSAHGAGLSVGQKNTAELGSAGRRTAGFDFAVVEECFQYKECGTFTKVYGKRVIDIEYTDEMRTSFAAMCASSARPPMTILRDRDLVPRGRSAYVFKHC